MMRLEESLSSACRSLRCLMAVCAVASQRGWTIPGVNTTNATGRALFKRSILTTVKRSVDYCTTGFMAGAARCQGMLVWSLEGQQYPQDISYIVR